MPQTLDAIWDARPPRRWAIEPAWMSVSTLLNMETCPRRWSLGSAEYPEIWDRYGYPPKPYLATLTGQVTHSALESITKALDRSGCCSTRDALFVSVLRELGGFSKIIEKTIDGFIQALSANPRARNNLDHLAIKLRAKVPELRTRLQMLISKLQIQSRDGGATPSKGKSTARRTLPVGMHAEVELRAEDLRWHGFVDCMNLSDTECEIIDFKTGEAKPDHEFQTRAYSLLWVRDAELNPTSRLVNKILLSYFDSEVEVTPLKSFELDDFERELKTRTEEALNLIRQDPPPAYPNLQNCRFCPVRQICDDYWKPAVQRRLKAERLEEMPAQPQVTFADLEVELRERQSLTSWSGIVTVSSEVVQGTAVHIQFSETNMPLLNMLEAGKRFRLIEANLTHQSEDQTSQECFIMLNTMSEAYVL